MSESAAGPPRDHIAETIREVAEESERTRDIDDDKLLAAAHTQPNRKRRPFLVTAVPWAHGWELHVDGVGVTQTHEDDGASPEDAVRDYLATHGIDGVTAEIRIDYPS